MSLPSLIGLVLIVCTLPAASSRGAREPTLTHIRDEGRRAVLTLHNPTDQALYVLNLCIVESRNDSELDGVTVIAADWNTERAVREPYIALAARASLSLTCLAPRLRDAPWRVTALVVRRFGDRDVAFKPRAVIVPHTVPPTRRKVKPLPVATNV